MVKAADVTTSADEIAKKGISLKPELSASVAKAEAIVQQKIDDLKRRRENPAGILMSPQSQDPIAQFTEDWIKDGEAGYTAPEDQAEQTIQKGYVPVINDATGEQVRVGNDLGFKRPVELYDADMNDVVTRSRARVDAFDEKLRQTKGEVEKAGIGGIDADVEVSRK